MASKSNVYAGVAGYVARADQKGTVGVFARPAETGRWEHVLTDHETYTVNIHPTNPNVVFAGTADGVYRSTDRGKSFQRTELPGQGRPDLVVPGRCQRSRSWFMPAARRSACIAARTPARRGAHCQIPGCRIGR